MTVWIVYVPGKDLPPNAFALESEAKKFARILSGLVFGVPAIVERELLDFKYNKEWMEEPTWVLTDAYWARHAETEEL